MTKERVAETRCLSRRHKDLFPFDKRQSTIKDTAQCSSCPSSLSHSKREFASRLLSRKNNAIDPLYEPPPNPQPPLPPLSSVFLTTNYNSTQQQSLPIDPFIIIILSISIGATADSTSAHAPIGRHGILHLLPAGPKAWGRDSDKDDVVVHALEPCPRRATVIRGACCRGAARGKGHTGTSALGESEAR